MRENSLLLIAAALGAWWWVRQRQRETTAAGDIAVDAQTNIVEEDSTGQAIEAVLKTLATNPDTTGNFYFSGNGAVVRVNTFPTGQRRSIPGQPPIYVP